jgi:hypothetical protein
MDEIKTKRKPVLAVGLDPDFYEKLSAVAAHESRSLADTARLLLYSGLFRYKQRGRLLDKAAYDEGELELFPLLPQEEEHRAAAVSDEAGANLLSFVRPGVDPAN